MTHLRSARASQRTGVALVLLATLLLLSSQRSAQADQLTIVTPSIQAKVNGSTQLAFAGNAAGQVNGGAVPWVFSLTYSANAYALGTYDTNITHDGKISGQTVNSAGQVAWLVTTYGAATVGNAELGAVLQAAIWRVIYGSNFDLKSFKVPGDFLGINNLQMMTKYNLYVAGAQTIGALAALFNPGLVGSVSWLTAPGSDGSSPAGFVTVGSVPSPPAPPAIATPEPTTLLIAGVGVVAMMLIHRRGKFRLDRETGEDANSSALASA